MARFAANLAYLFTERPFMERFAAAAAAGFRAVELQFPYDVAPSAVQAEPSATVSPCSASTPRQVAAKPANSGSPR